METLLRKRGAGCLGGHVATHWDDVSAETGDEVADVGVGAMDYMFCFYDAS